MTNFDLEYQKYFQYFNQYLDDVLSKLDPSAPSVIKEAMSYAIKDGGKRVRPVLCFLTGEMLNIPHDKLKEFALAIELIHSYSLVHDDLPAMDNDDFRRGKFSTHKKYGEAIGILAGDALLNFAFEHVINKKEFSQNDINALKILSNYAGYSGMIAGQVVDLQSENLTKINEQTLYYIYLNKTAKLIMAPILIASAIEGDSNYESLYNFGYHLGITFQIVDDILDEEGDFNQLGKSLHKDKQSGKLTAVSVFGLKNAKEKAREHYQKCIESIKCINGNELLLSFAKKMLERKK